MTTLVRSLRTPTLATDSPFPQRRRFGLYLRWEHRGICGQPIFSGELTASVKDREHGYFLKRIAADAAPQSLTTDVRVANDAALKDRAHLEYLNRLAADGVVPKSLATVARTVWWLARLSAGSRLPVPAASTFAGGPVEYLWSNGPHQLSVEIPANGACHWTYRNSRTGELWGVEIMLAEGLSPRIERALARIVAGTH